MTSRSMNSTAVGTELAPITSGTARIAAGSSVKGTSKLTLYLGSGSKRSIALVTMPSVPSEPTIKSLRL